MNTYMHAVRTTSYWGHSGAERDALFYFGPGHCTRERGLPAGPSPGGTNDCSYLN